MSLSAVYLCFLCVLLFSLFLHIWLFSCWSVIIYVLVTLLVLAFIFLSLSWLLFGLLLLFFFFKQKTASELRISDWSSDVCSSDLPHRRRAIHIVNRIGGARVIRQVGRALQHGETDRFRQLAAFRRAVRRTGDQKGFGGRRHRKARRAIGAVVTDRRRPCLASDEGAIQFLLCLRHPQRIGACRRIVGPAGGNAVASGRRGRRRRALPDKFDQLAVGAVDPVNAIGAGRSGGTGQALDRSLQQRDRLRRIAPKAGDRSRAGLGVLRRVVPCRRERGKIGVERVHRRRRIRAFGRRNAERQRLCVKRDVLFDHRLV